MARLIWCCARRGKQALPGINQADFEPAVGEGGAINGNPVRSSFIRRATSQRGRSENAIEFQITQRRKQHYQNQKNIVRVEATWWDIEIGGEQIVDQAVSEMLADVRRNHPPDDPVWDAGPMEWIIELGGGEEITAAEVVE